MDDNNLEDWVSKAVKFLIGLLLLIASRFVIGFLFGLLYYR